MRVTIVPKAISWKVRKIKVVDNWALVSQDIDLADITLNKCHDVEVETNLKGNQVITKIYEDK